MNARQDNLEIGERLRDQGVADTLAADDSVTRGYGVIAAERIATFAAAGMEFTAEDIRESVSRSHPELQPHSPNVLPATFQAAARAKVIRFTGRVAQATRPSRHASVLRIWRGSSEAAA